ncbi:MAG TPA: TetR/AcrR family transcriptional regulator C-terminal domain-containing protein [Polyangiales bacterium]|nr:TetR/AcrR family transcriptional regulator C-terminal domain-containing protein [Polyangiales bacterium]
MVGRRGGRVKKPLDHDAIVDKALELLARDGLPGMSLRSVAKALDTGPASLYVYVSDLQALHALVLDRALASVSLRVARDKPWRERLEAVLASYYRVLFRHRGLAQLAMSTIAAGPNALRLIETLLGILDDGGIDETSAAWAVDLLMLYVTSIAFEQSQRAVDGDDPLANVARAIGQVSASEHPRVHRAREALLSGDGSARFSWALHVLLEGILRVPTHTPRKTKTRRTA